MSLIANKTAIVDHKEICERVRELGPWWHQIDLGNGIYTRDISPINPDMQKSDYPLGLMKKISNYIPKDLRGSSVLDMGCADGFFSIECAKRGADSVLAVDILEHSVRKVLFVRDQLNLPQIDAKQLSVHDAASLQQTFDLTLMLGVIYHLENPLHAIEEIAKVSDMLILESAVLIGGHGKTIAQFDRYGEQIYLPTCEWIEDALSSVGYSTVERLPMLPNAARAIYVCKK